MLSYFILFLIYGLIPCLLHSVLSIFPILLKNKEKKGGGKKITKKKKIEIKTLSPGSSHDESPLIYFFLMRVMHVKIYTLSTIVKISFTTFM